MTTFFHKKRHVSGFSLIELLVVISLIALLTGISFPVLRILLSSTAINTAEGQVNNALTAARVFATQNKPFVNARPIGGALRTSNDNGDGFSGAIVLFANDNTLRVCENDENARDPGATVPWLEFMSPRRNGYTPVPDLEDSRLSGRVQALGIVRTGSGAFDVRLVPPPFAIRVDRNGVLGEGEEHASSSMDVPWDRVVDVSATGDVGTFGSGPGAIEFTLYDIDVDRNDVGSGFDPFEFGIEGTERMPDGRVQLPFGVVETVSGVLIVEPDEVPLEFLHPNPSFGGTNPVSLSFNRDTIEIYSEAESAAILNWAAENPIFGRIMLFNRYTGQDLTR